MKKNYLIQIISVVIVLTNIVSGCASKIKVFKIDKDLSIGRTAANQEIYLGGFSALVKTADKNTFLTITDRGPNAEPIEIKNIGKNLRPFLLPEFTPRIVEIKLTDSEFNITNQIFLKDSESKPLSGLPNLAPTNDELAIDSFGKILSPDLMGIDSEGLAIDQQGNYWVSEEYRPSILKFDSKGVLIRRFIPMGSFSDSVIKNYNKNAKRTILVADLPNKLLDRKINRGFEGLSIHKNHVFFILQSPLTSSSQFEKQSVPIYKFDIVSEKIIAECKYEFSDIKTDKIGDLVVYGDTSALVIEQNSTSHKIYKIDFGDCSNQPVSKKLLVDLEALGFKGFDKIEGISIVDNSHIAIIVDNDFGICSDLDVKTGKVDLSCNKKSVLAVIEVGDRL